MTLSIAWASPFSRNSDVSSFSRALLAEFARVAEGLGANVSLLVNENGPTYWTTMPTITLTGEPSDRELLAAFDVVIFNIGNNQENHGHINRLALDVPGVVVVHDMVMQHYLAWLLFENRGRRDFYARLMGEYYGAAGLDLVAMSQICAEAASPIYAPWDSLHVADTPLIEPFLHSAAAVVVHSAYAERMVREATKAPVLRLQLPWDQKLYPSDDDLARWVQQTRERRVCNVVSFGHITRNKCLELAIEAFGASALLRERARLLIVGFPRDAQYVEELRAEAAQLGLSAIVTFEFAVTDERLLTIKEEADIFVNLRHPNTESASGSLIEQMNAGKPVLLFPTGSYAEIDDDAAIRVDRAAGGAGLAEALETAVTDPERRIAIGARGRAQVRRIGCREYIAGLWAFLQEHAALLRARRHCIAGRRGTPTTCDAAGEAWLTALARTRRLLAGLDSDAIEIDVAPFQDWNDDALHRYVVVGLFGQLIGSQLDREMQALIEAGDRLACYEAVARARALAGYVRRSERRESERASPLMARPVLVPAAWQLLGALDPEVFARSCYVGLLGRQPNIGETDAHASRAARGAARAVVAGFLASEEFTRRGIAEDESTALLAWCEATGETERVRPELAPGMPLIFSRNGPDAAPYLASGWYMPEEHVVWSRLPVSVLAFQVPQGRVRRLRLMIQGRFPPPVDDAPRELRIACNEDPPIVITADSEAWFLAALPITLPEAGAADCVVQFDCGRLVNLAAAGIADDTRDLGLCLRSVVLSEE